MKRTGKLEKDIRHWMEMKRNSKPNIPYEYGGVFGQSSKDNRAHNKIFMEKAQAPLSTNMLQSSMSTYFRTNDSSRNGFRTQSRANKTSCCTTQDYTQQTSIRDNQKPLQQNFMSKIALQSTTNILPEGEELMVSDRSFQGIDTSYLQNQNISLISRSNYFNDSQKDSTFIKSSSTCTQLEACTLRDSDTYLHQREKSQIGVSIKPQSCQHRIQSKSMHGVSKF